MDGGAVLLREFGDCLRAQFAIEIGDARESMMRARRDRTARRDVLEVEILPHASTEHAYEVLEEQARARLGGERFAIVAESFSGPIAIRIAADPPPGLRGVVLVATFAARPLPAMLARWVGAWAFALAPPPFVLRRTLLDASASDALVDEVRRAIAATPARTMAMRARAALSIDVREELSRVRMPMLVVGGARDRVLDAGAITRWRSDLRIEVVDAPHLVLQSAPEVAAERVARFLARL
jgi:pimeloyl-ACP methyl ester carboxylesterase